MSQQGENSVRVCVWRGGKKKRKRFRVKQNKFTGKKKKPTK